MHTVSTDAHQNGDYVTKKIRSSYSKSQFDLELLPKLHRDIYLGNYRKIMKRVSTQKNLWKIDRVDYAGRTPLHLAASVGDLATVRLLISMGSLAVNQGDEQGCTPFLKAGECGSLECMQEMHKHSAYLGANNVVVNMTVTEQLATVCTEENLSCFEFAVNNHVGDLTNMQGMSLLHIAAAYGSIVAVKYLLTKRNVDVNSTEINGRTPLMLAVSRDHLDVVEYLLKSGADPIFKDEQDHDALFYAEQRGKGCDSVVREYKEAILQARQSTNQVFVRRGNDTNYNKHIFGMVDHENERIESKETVEVKEAVDINTGLVKEASNHAEKCSFEEQRNKDLSQRLEKLQEKISAKSMGKFVKKERKHEAKERKSDKQLKKRRLSFKKLKSFVFKRNTGQDESWEDKFNRLLSLYEELQHAHEQLLSSETDKELDIEEGNERIGLLEEKTKPLTKELKRRKEDYKKHEKSIKENSEKREMLNEEVAQMKEVLQSYEIKMSEIESLKISNKTSFDEEVNKLRNDMEENLKAVGEMRSNEDKLKKEIAIKNDKAEEQKEFQKYILGKFNELKKKYKALKDSKEELAQ